MALWLYIAIDAKHDGSDSIGRLTSQVIPIIF